MKSYSDFDIDVKGRTSGQYKTLCPKCSHTRKKGKREPCLSINLDMGVWNCKHCEWTGTINESEKKTYVRPKFQESGLSIPTKMIEYFNSRGISQATVAKHKVTAENQYIARDEKDVGCIVWNYFRDGKLVNKKYRSNSKGFRMESGAELILYNIDGMSGDSVIVTEGEFDCMTYDEEGYPSVVSVPNGANIGTNNLQYLENCYDKFVHMKKIYLAVDSDEAGAVLLNELARRLGKERCYKVSYPDGCKDANDTLVKHGRDALAKTISEAQPFPLEGVITADSVRTDIHRIYREGIPRGVELDELGAEWCKLCTLETSMLYVVTGIPAHGKSTFVNNMEILSAAKHGWKWAIFSPEHFPLENFIYKYAEILVGQPFFDGKTRRMNTMTVDMAVDFIHEHFYFIRPEGELFTIDKILEVAKSLVFRYGVKGFTIDPWNTIQHDFGSLSETQYIERTLNKLTIFKQVYDLCVLVVAHPRKIRKEGGVYEVPSLYDVAGSSNFFNKCDFGITIYRNFAQNTTEVYVQKCKFKNLGEIGWTAMSFDFAVNRFVPNNMDFNRVSYIEPPEQSAIAFGNSDFEEDVTDLPF